MKIVIASLVAALALTCMPSVGKEKEYQVDLSKPGEPVNLNVDVYYGSVNVQGYDGEEVIVMVNARADLPKESDVKEKHQQYTRQQQKNPPRSSEGLRKISSNALQVSIRESNNRVYIESERSDKFVEILVRVPKRASVSAEVYRGGEINIDNITGALELETWRAGIVARGVTGPIVAETYDSDIVVAFSQFSEQNPSSIASHSGNIDVTLSNKSKAKIKLQNYKGEIYSGLSADFVSEDQVKRNADRSGQEIVIGSMLAATVNGGEQTLTLVSYSGDFYLRQ